MLLSSIQGVLLLGTIIVFVVFIIVFSLVVRDFDKRFNLFLKTAPLNIKNISVRLDGIHDVLLVMSTLLKPSCIEVLRKHIITPSNELLRDIYLCSQIEDTCQGRECCCSCIHQKDLYALTADEELKSVAVICKVKDVDTIISGHGHCVLYERGTLR